MHTELLTRNSVDGQEATPSQGGRFWWAAVSWSCHWPGIQGTRLGAANDIQAVPGWRLDDMPAAGRNMAPSERKPLLLFISCAADLSIHVACYITCARRDSSRIDFKSNDNGQMFHKETIYFTG